MNTAHIVPRVVSAKNAIRDQAWRIDRLASVALLVMAGLTSSLAAGEPSLTFFAWSDQHVQVDGNGEHLKPAIDAMNQLPAKAFPSAIGGKVRKPAFVFGCGDISEWPSHAALETYQTLVTQRLRFPTYDVIGNHDEGGIPPNDTIKKWLIDRHGSLTYSFEKGGVRFIALYSKYDESLNSPAQPLTKESLRLLRDELKKDPPETPTIVATHLCYDAMTNRDALVDVLGPYNVLAVLGGHYHKAKVDHYRGRTFVQIPSPAPGSPSEFMVVRITSDRIVALPYDYEHGTWSTLRGKMLDVALSKPESAKE